MKTSVQRKIRQALGDMYSFVLSQEANWSIQAVTLPQLLQEQIARNGDSDRSNAAQFNPYSFDPESVEPASERPLSRANFLSGTDTNNPTKLDRVLAIKNSVEDLIDHVKSLPFSEIQETEDRSDDDLLYADAELVGSDAVLEDLEVA